MPATLAELARIVQGRLIGSSEVVVSGAATLRDAVAGELTLIDQADKIHLLKGALAAAAIVPLNVTCETMPVIQVADAHQAFRQVVLHFRPSKPVRRIGISSAAIVAASAQLGPDVDVHPGATVGEEVMIGAGSTIHAGAHVMAHCIIGDNVTIFPGAVLYEGTVVGPRVIVHAGAVLGAYGFGYKLVDGRHQLSSQLGSVVLEADVEVGAGTTIDRGTYGPTRVGEGTKIDNQVMIGHNCRIGRHNLLCSQVGIAGSTTTGDYVVMAGQVGVRDHVHIGDKAIIGAKSGVPNDVPAGAHVLGIPALPLREQKLTIASLIKLPEMRRDFKALQRAVADLQKPEEGDHHAAA